MLMHRRRLLAVAPAATLASVVRQRRALAQAASGPFRLPFIGPFSGPIGIVGQPALTGAQFTVEEINRAGGIMGRPLELVVRDAQGKPELAAAAAQELAAGGLHLLIAGLSTPEGLAVMPIMKSTNSVQILLAGSGTVWKY